MSTTYVQGNLNNILVVAITRMGDMLQASPTIAGMREEHPEAKITVFIEKGFASICDGIPGIDEVVTIDMPYVCRCLHQDRDGIVDAYRYVSEVVTDLKEREFDYVLNMSSSPYTALLLKMLDAPESRGWTADEEGFRIISNPWAMLFAAFVFHSNRDYNSINLVDIFRCSAGVKAHPPRLVYEVNQDSRDFVDDFLKERNLGSSENGSQGRLVAIQAGASQQKRQWAPFHFASLTKQLVEDLDAEIVFTGSQSEQGIVDSILAQYSHPRVTSAVGKTNLAQLAALLERAEVLITGDTGPMHLSVAVGTPVVSLFLASALCFETGPYNSGSLVIQPLVSCNPCNPNFPCTRPDCHEQVTPKLVCELARARMEKSDHELLNWKEINQLASSSDVSVYLTMFDEDGFLDFKRLNASSERHGFPGEYFDCARQAYRILWKKELGAVEQEIEVDQARDAALRQTLGVDAAIDRCALGVSSIERLLELIANPNSPPHLLGETNRVIEENDAEIEKIGLSHPILGAMIRMFIMEKENMRGSDPTVLASQMKELYETLERRARSFSGLFERYWAQGQGLEQW